MLKKWPFILLSGIIVAVMGVYLIKDNSGYTLSIPSELKSRNAANFDYIDRRVRQFEKTLFSDGTGIEIIGWKTRPFDHSRVYEFAKGQKRKWKKEFYFKFVYKGKTYTLYFYPNYYHNTEVNDYVAAFDKFFYEDVFDDQFDAPDLDRLLEEIDKRSMYSAQLPSAVSRANLSRTKIKISDFIARYGILQDAQWSLEYGSYKVPFNYNAKLSDLYLIPVGNEWYAKLVFQESGSYAKRATYHVGARYIHHSEIVNLYTNRTLKQHTFFNDASLKDVQGKSQ